MNDVLEVRDLSVRFDALKAVDGLDLDLPAAQVTALIGPNGAGKSTAFNAITGFVAAEAGSVRLAGRSLLGLQPHEIAVHGVVRTFQRKSIFPRLTVEENLRVALYRRPTDLGARRRRAARGPSSRGTAVGTAAAELIARLRLGDPRRPAGTLPYGRQRFLAVGVALAARPRFLLLDEPTAGLNATETDQMAELLSEVAADGTGILLVEHDMRFVMGLATRVAVLSAGTKIADGTPREVQASPQVRAAYLGERHRAS
ncbi:MAG: ATP-binding cassette domain-containing protein [Streptosporangiales bacterium]|nr:ATP-binding cassette domain-containing protein [Streptosporangiales bacterium]